MYSGNAASGGSTAQQDTVGRVLDAAQLGLDDLLKRLDMLHGNITGAADGLLGMEPPHPATSGAQAATPASGRGDSLRRSIASAHDMMSAIEAQFSRFNAL